MVHPQQHRTRTGPAGKRSLNRAGAARNVAETQTLVSAYEALRQPAVDGSSSGGLGHGSFAWPGNGGVNAPCSWVPSTAPDNLRLCPSIAVPLPDDLRSEVVLVLAAMALNQAAQIRP
jgi:hypothetical protein